MNDNAKLEAYLRKLDKALNAIDVSDRAEIVTEIKSHVLDALERDDTQSIESVLSSLGEPETVANRYLLERGLRPSKPPRPPIFKWFVVGGLGTVAIVVFTVFALIWTFTPLIEFDKDQGRVVLFGGRLIDISSQDGDLKFGVFSVNEDSLKFEGSAEVDVSEDSALLVKFNNGKIEFENSSDNSFSWECRTGENEKAVELIKQEGQAIFDMSDLSGVKCDFKVPAQMNVNLEGENGKVDVEQPRFHLDVKMDNGKIYFKEDESVSYKFRTFIKNGMKDDFESSDDENAFQISLALKNGMISRD